MTALHRLSLRPLRALRWFAAGAALAALALASLFVGVVDISLADLWSDTHARSLVLESRLPRSLAALLAGASLAVTGQIMQILARNRFVEPMSAGAGQSAALGVLLAVLVFPASAIWAKMALASVCALLGSAGLMWLIRALPPTQPLLIPLVALVYGGMIGAAVTFVAYQGDLMQFLGIWLTGELSGVLRGRYELLWIAGVTAAVSWLVADRLTLLSLGQEAATGLGLNVRRVTAAGLIVLSVATAVVVVTVGAIPFVGLVVPNLVARRMGDNLRGALPVAACLGAGLVLAADIAGRLIRHPFEIPVATMVGVIGALLFLILLWWEPRHA
ncbi:MAG: ABC transporter permease [Paracoccaceae bacterium]